MIVIMSIMGGLFLFTFIGVIVFMIVKGARHAATPITTAYGTIIAKRTQVVGSENSAGTLYYATIETQDGNRKEYQINGNLYGLVKEGDKGTLVLKGKRLLNIDRHRKPENIGMYCDHCGTYIENNAAKCSACGAGRNKTN